jgi:hypothetical protein
MFEGVPPVALDLFKQVSAPLQQADKVIAKLTSIADASDDGVEQRLN